MNKNLWIILLLVFGLSAAFAFACAQHGEPEYPNDASGPGGGGGRGDDDDNDDDNDDASPTGTAVAYVYGTGGLDDDDDSATVAGFEALLAKAGIAATAFNEDEFVNATLSDFDAVIADATTTWANQTSVVAVRDAGIPVLGIMTGGGELFDYLDLNIGFSNGTWEYNDTQVRVVDPSHAVFRTPHNLKATQGELLTMSATPFNIFYHDMSVPPPNTLDLADRVVQTNYGVLTLEDGKYLFWGLDAPPTTFSAVAADLFVNCVTFLAGAK
jgi:hypothetical protein